MPPVSKNRSKARALPPPDQFAEIDILKPRTWIRFKPEYCRGCFAGCCTLPVRVDAEDLHHMGFIRHDQVNGPLKRIASRLKREETIASYNDHTRTFVLKQRPNHDCVFLDSNRLCKIYDRRPAVCREFPKNSIRPNHCPATRKEGPPSHD